MKFWLIVERYENWKIDRREGFKRFGLPLKKQKMARDMKAGDLLLTYISSGKSAFSDVRCVTKDGAEPIRRGSEYDTAFPIAIQTRPVVTLQETSWIPFKGLAPKLSFTAGHEDWRQLLRTSLRRLPNEDGLLLHQAIVDASRVPEK